MLEGMYSAAAGMAAQQQRLDAVANDLANVNTTGYKPVRVAFRDLVYSAAARGTASGVETGAGAAATSLGRSAKQGPLQSTNRQLDLALDGQGYFAVTDATGRPALTRDGGLRIDPTGRLATEDGNLLEPRVTVPQGTTEHEVKIGEDGTVWARGARVGQIRIVTVPSPSNLEGLGDNLFRTNAASGQPVDAPRSTRIVQGALEGSGVDVADAMTDLTLAQRAYQLASRSIKTQDELMEIANGVKR